MKKILALVVLIIVGVVTYGHYGTGPSLPNVPALRLEKAAQNVYPEPNGLVSLTLHFENKVDPQQFVDRVADLTGVRKVYQVGKGNRVFEVTFDPGYTSHSKLLAELYPRIDDQSLFQTN